MEPLSVFQFFLSRTKKNCIICSKCETKTTNGHFYAIQFYTLEEKDTNVYWKGKYTVGCSHEEYDGDSWCDGCYTIMNNQIMCSKCAKISWGKPTIKKNTSDTYTWIDGSESSYDKPVKKLI